MIEVEGLTKYFGRIAAVKNVSFKIAKGEIVGFLGPNGSGKTTTMRMLTCFFPPTNGSARVAGYDVVKDSLNVRRRIGYFLEKAPLYPDMSVRAFLNFVANVKGVRGKDRIKTVSKLIEECGIGHVAERLIGNISKGYRQRVCLAQALIHNPEVLILDEPTAGLDPEQVVEVRKLIKDLGGERTILLSTHILPEVSMTCQRVIIINEGEIVAMDTPESLMKKLKSSCQILVQIEGPSLLVIEELKKIPEVTHVKEKERMSENAFSYLIESKKDGDITKDISSCVFKNNWYLLEMRPIEMTLEDIFLKLVTEEKGVRN
jgi:ABC-2 type transport system ATP-binding protein